MMIEVIAAPKKNPRLHPIGPQRPPRDWPSPRSIDLKAPEYLNFVYDIWISGTEEELCDLHDLVTFKKKPMWAGKGSARPRG